METGLIRTLPSGWRDVVLVCGKCSRKLDGGFGDKGRQSLAKALRRARGLKARKADAGVVETRCLGVCPKRAVMVVDAAAPTAWLVVPAGTPIETVAARLAIGRRIDPADGPGGIGCAAGSGDPALLARIGEEAGS